MKKTYMAPRTEVTRIEEMTLMAASTAWEVGHPDKDGKVFNHPIDGTIDFLGKDDEGDISDAKRGYDLWED